MRHDYRRIVNGHLFGAGDPGAAKARMQRRRDAQVRNTWRARQNTAQVMG